MSDHRPARSGREAGERERRAVAAIDVTENRMVATVNIGFPGEVDSPDEVPRQALRLGVFDLPAQHINLVTMSAQDFRDVALTDDHLPGCAELAIEHRGNAPAPGVGHQRLQADDFATDPGGLPNLAVKQRGYLSDPAVATHRRTGCTKQPYPSATAA